MQDYTIRNVNTTILHAVGCHALDARSGVYAMDDAYTASWHDGIT